MKLPGVSAAKCACQTCLVSKTVRNLLFVEAFWLLPKGLGETATAGEKASFFIIWRENMWTDKVQVSLVKKCFSNNVFLSFALVKTRSHLKIWSQTPISEIALTSPSDFFFYMQHIQILFNLYPVRPEHPTLTPRWHREPCMLCTSATWLKCSNLVHTRGVELPQTAGLCSVTCPAWSQHNWLDVFGIIIWNTMGNFHHPHLTTVEMLTTSRTN